ncbi:hypothetical protein TNCV_4048391 [Trichonephila clavipes]|nr:hypothetical protein TNCV_4048391 [Trichonephila clavipes]
MAMTPHPKTTNTGNSQGIELSDRKRKLPLRHGDTLSSRRTASPLIKLVNGEERGKALTLPQGVLPQNWGGTELNRSVICIVLKATANDRRTSRPLL